MGRFARRRRAAAAPSSGQPAGTYRAGRDWVVRHWVSQGPARNAALLSVVAIVGIGGIGLGSQLVVHGQTSQAAALTGRDAGARALPRPVLRGPDAPGAVAARGSASEAAWQASPARAQARSFRRIIIPDLLIVAPKGLTSRDVARLGRIAGVRNMIAFDGAQITAGGRTVNAIGVNPVAFRSWVPLRTASDQPFWTALSRGEFVAADSSARRLHLRTGSSYQLVAASSAAVTFGSAARLGLNGVDVLVNQSMSRQLGLVHQVAALLSAPGVSMAKLTRAVTAILGSSARMESLRAQQLPGGSTSGGLPTTYIQLFKASAARYCPGLSWTVLAAIGQIESGDGTNEGPSTAGALGPMQFMPSTWASWGIDGFGQTGTPNVMNPYDAVPSAARLLCADGAAGGGHALYNAIFDYNHADWYVREVLALAAEYGSGG
jgi:hypothetical protein